MLLGVEYLVTFELHRYIRDSYVPSVIRIGQRKVRDIEIFVEYVIECFVAILYDCLRTVPFESVEYPDLSLSSDLNS